MMKDIAVVMIHGMGNFEKCSEGEKCVKGRTCIKAEDGYIGDEHCFGNEMMELLEKKLEPEVARRIHYEKIFYSDILQEPQNEMLEVMKENIQKSKSIILRLRKFMMYNISDAAALSSQVYQEGKPYYKVQERIREALKDVYCNLNERDKKVIVVADSLGAHVISNYIWDCQNELGMFDQGNFPQNALGVKVLSDEEKFLRLQNMKSLITTGCNIPLLIGAHKKVVAISTSDCGYDFRWYNYYDKDDILGWPLRCIPHDCDEECKKYGGRNHTYDKAVHEDKQINAGRGMGRLTRSWNPFSHLEYWRDDDVITGIANEIYRLI